jgi:hypothetical protein
MADDPLFIEDGFTRTHRIPAVPGLHPAVRVEFRPALAKERAAYGVKLGSKDPDAVSKYEDDLIARYVLMINGLHREDWKDKVARIHPEVRRVLQDLVLGYTAAEERADLGN